MRIRHTDSFGVKNRKELGAGARSTDVMEAAALEPSPRAHGTGGLGAKGRWVWQRGIRLDPRKDRECGAADAI